ncbi:shootin-1-like isoform X2 [Rhinatrema bivittatum]|uniref:shootin-1-like isoform X2 n=1 Tax=Rhinatrema bivittatum TaxID=194408 RepID=UPI00112AC26B|nr:shootin-1-like isoform X2 [Rhinatrema bivittatum]
MLWRLGGAQLVWTIPKQPLKSSRTFLRMDFLSESLGELSASLKCCDSDSSDTAEEKVDVQTALQERDEVHRKLLEIKELSERLLSEFASLETEFEIEKSCREQAEVYATQMKNENKKLKRVSMQILPMLNTVPEDILLLLQESEVPAEPGPDPECEQYPRDVQDTVSRLLEEKHKLNIHIEELQNQISHLNDQIEEERSEKISLQRVVEGNQRIFKKFSRVSRTVTQEYNELVQKLEEEKDLRQHAEVFAHKMLRKQKEANRQSMLLLKTAESNAPLLQALDEIANMTKALEDAKEEHQAAIIALETQLEEKHLQEELKIIQEALNATKEEKLEIENQLRQAEERNSDLEGKIKVLEEKLKMAETLSSEHNNSTMAPAPPPLSLPPPPPPPPPPFFLEDSLSLIKQRRGRREMNPKQGNGSNDEKAQAVKEMMDRIKNGVVLRPARKDQQGQSAAASKRKSAVSELQGILDSMKTPRKKSSYPLKVSQKIKDNQLESILERRRKMSDFSSAAQSSSPSTAATESCDQADSEEGKGLPIPWVEQNHCGGGRHSGSKAVRQLTSLQMKIPN